MAKTKLAILISGRGSNLKSLIEACAAENFPAEIALVISNRPAAAGLEIARGAGIKTSTIDHKLFGADDAGRVAFDSAVSDAIEEASAEYVCLAGFMRLLSPDFVTKWRGKLLNIHPSLLPAFKGLNVHERMIIAGIKIAGCTVHFVSTEMDAGPIVGQAAVPVLPGDDAEKLAARILAAEHRLYPACVKLVAERRARLMSNGVVQLDAGPNADALLFSPPA